MCHLVTVGILKFSGNAPDVFRGYRLKATAAVNPSVRAAMPRDSSPFDVTQGGCSCGIYSRAFAPPGSTLDEAVERRRYAKKGWSEAKIDRAIQAKKHAQDRRPGENPDVFMHAIEDIVRSGGIVVLMAHEYRGRYDEEPVQIKGRVTMSIEEFHAQKAAIPEDTAVWIG